ncbi:MAG: hypothetical protein ACI4TK_07925 [Agathobacter sp.]
MKIKRKKMWICLLVVGISIGVVVGILIYADFSYSVTVVPLVVDDRSGIKCGWGWMLLERIKQIICK